MENRKFKKFIDWVNADTNLPVYEEDNENNHTDSHHDTHDLEKLKINEDILDEVLENYEDDDEFDYPDEISLPFDQGVEDLSHQIVPMTRKEKRQLGRFRMIYVVISFVVAINLIGILLFTVSRSPLFGLATNPAVNEVSTRYLEQSVSETSSLNVVTAVLFNYRSFDTLGEAVMLFTAAIAVVLVMIQGVEKNKKHSKRDDKQETRENATTDGGRRLSLVLSSSAKADDLINIYKNKPFLFKAVVGPITPFIMIYGIYILFNGHLSPGGSFSGGTILGAGLVLCSITYGKAHMSKFLSFKTTAIVSSVALAFYALIKGYAFMVGASGNSTGIPLGTPGNIISGGLILPLTISVGLVVACTIYNFYELFSDSDE